MATVTIQLTNDLGQTAGRVKTISGADLQRFLTAWRALYGDNPTDQQVAQRWADQLLLETKTAVRNFEAGAAVATAMAGVSDINI